MQFIDLAAQQKRIRDQIEKGIAAVLDHGQYIMGPEIKQLEDKLAEFADVQHAVSCASGTDALLMALMAYGVGPGDAIFTSPFTFIATAEVVRLLGATPVFVDIDRLTFNLEPAQLENAVKALKSRDVSRYPLPEMAKNGLTPKGIISVDLFGLPADYDAIDRIAKTHGLFVIEDAAQSFGAQYNGQKAGALGNIGCTSFFPAKPLGCYGDGGMCFTDDHQLADVMRSIRVHGKGGHKYDNVRVGINGRLDTMQAAILLAKFDIFKEEIELRRQAAARYEDRLSQIEWITVPKIPTGCQSAWAQYSVLAHDQSQRERLQAALNDAGVPTAVYYPRPLHLQSAFSHLGYREGNFPASEECSRRIFSLPMHPYLQSQDQEMIANIIKQQSV